MMIHPKTRTISTQRMMIPWLIIIRKYSDSFNFDWMTHHQDDHHQDDHFLDDHHLDDHHQDDHPQDPLDQD